MKRYAITTHVIVEDEALLIQCAREQYDRDNGDGTGAEDITTVEQALEELSHFGDPFHDHGPRPPLVCGVEIQERTVQCTHVGTPPDDRR